MVDAQTWLNQTIPNCERENINKLLIGSSEQQNSFRHQETYWDYNHKYYLSNPLTGTLDLSSFPNLEGIVVEKQYMSCLILTNCEQIKEIYAENNILQQIVFPEQALRLKRIFLTNNNFPSNNLFCFSNFTNLEQLYLGTNDLVRISQNVYNRWNGTLNYLQGLTKLEELAIDATDISSGLENLPLEKLHYFTFGSKGRSNAGVNQLKRVLENHILLDEGESMEIWAADDDLDNNLYKIGQLQQWQSEQNQSQIQMN